MQNGMVCLLTECKGKVESGCIYKRHYQKLYYKKNMHLVHFLFIFICNGSYRKVLYNILYQKEIKEEKTKLIKVKITVMKYGFELLIM